MNGVSPDLQQYMDEIQWLLEHPGVERRLSDAGFGRSFDTASLLARDATELARLVISARRIAVSIATPNGSVESSDKDEDDRRDVLTWD